MELRCFLHARNLKHFVEPSSIVGWKVQPVISLRCVVLRCVALRCVAIPQPKPAHDTCELPSKIGLDMCCFVPSCLICDLSRSSWPPPHGGGALCKDPGSLATAWGIRSETMHHGSLNPKCGSTKRHLMIKILRTISLIQFVRKIFFLAAGILKRNCPVFFNAANEDRHQVIRFACIFHRRAHERASGWVRTASLPFTTSSTMHNGDSVASVADLFPIGSVRTDKIKATLCKGGNSC